MKPLGGTLQIVANGEGGFVLNHERGFDRRTLVTFHDTGQPDRPDPEVFAKWVRERLRSMETEDKLRAERDELYSRLLQTESALARERRIASDALVELERMTGDTCPITGHECDRGCPDVDAVYCEREEDS